MTTYSDSPKTFTAGEALDAFLRVKLHGRTVYKADAVDYGIGTVIKDAAEGADVGVRDYKHGGSHKMVANGSIEQGRKVYAAADGKIADDETLLIGTALDEASGDDSVIEVWVHPAHQQSSSSSSFSSSTSSSTSGGG